MGTIGTNGNTMEDIIENLRHIGLNTYEAKVYLALLQHHPATGYEVSKSSNVPQARAYDTLKALENRKLVVATEGKPVTYLPVAPEEVLKTFEKKYQGSINFLRTTLPNFAVESVEPIHNLRGSRTIFEHIVDIINGAQETLFIEAWQEDQPFIIEALRSAVERGVKVFLVGYHKLDIDFCKVYHHDREETIESFMGERWFLIAADSNEALVTLTPVKGNTGDPYAIWSKNATIVLLIKELVIHDIFLLDVEQTLREPMEKAYGSQELKLRNKILGNEVLIGAH